MKPTQDAFLCLRSAGSGTTNGRTTWQSPAALFTPQSGWSTMAGDRLSSEKRTLFSLLFRSRAAPFIFRKKPLFLLWGGFGLFCWGFLGRGREAVFGFFGVGQSAWNVPLSEHQSQVPALGRVGKRRGRDARGATGTQRPKAELQTPAPAAAGKAASLPKRHGLSLVLGLRTADATAGMPKTKRILITQQDWLLQSPSLCIFFCLPLDVYYYHDLF